MPPLGHLAMSRDVCDSVFTAREARASGHWRVESLDGARHPAAPTTQSLPTTANGDSYRTSPSKVRKKDRSKDEDRSKGQRSDSLLNMYSFK